MDDEKLRKIATVKEFEYITFNKDYENNKDNEKEKKYNYIEEKYFREFKEFVSLQNSKDEENDTEALDFFKVFTKSNVGEVIQARNYVGLVQLESGFQIQILPKVDFEKENSNNVKSESEKTTIELFLKMLRSFKDFPKCKVFNYANLKTEKMSIYEIFIAMYVQQVFYLVKHGLKSSYVRVEDNMNFYKGKLLVSEHIRKNTVHQERFYVAFDEYSLNRPENKIIKSTLLKLQKTAQSSDNIKNIRHLLSFFELVDPSINYSSDFFKVSNDRTMKEYEDILSWSKVFLLNKSFSSFSGNTKAKALLFPMEKLYESYVAQELVSVLDDEWSISVQDSRYYLFSEPERKFNLKPDIVLSKEGKTVVLDTKWKRLSNDKNNNYGISQADMYQMYAYAKKYNTKHIWLVYPVTEDTKSMNDIHFISKEGNNNIEIDDVIVSLFFVNLPKITDESDKGSLVQLLKYINQCQK